MARDAGYEVLEQRIPYEALWEADEAFTVGTAVVDCRRNLQIAEAHDGVSAILGLHPHEAGNATDADIDEFVRAYSVPHGFRGATGLYQSLLAEGAELRALSESAPKPPAQPPDRFGRVRPGSVRRACGMLAAPASCLPAHRQAAGGGSERRRADALGKPARDN